MHEQHKLTRWIKINITHPACISNSVSFFFSVWHCPLAGNGLRLTSISKLFLAFSLTFTRSPMYTKIRSKILQPSSWIRTYHLLRGVRGSVCTKEQTYVIVSHSVS